MPVYGGINPNAPGGVSSGPVRNPGTSAPSGGGSSNPNVGMTEGGFAFPMAPEAPMFPVVPYVNPLGALPDYADANRKQFQTNFEESFKYALDLLNFEFSGLQQFNRAARGLQQEGISAENEFNRGQFASANQFNMGEFAGANQFNRSQIPAANQFNQAQIPGANAFNQQQKLKALDVAVPGAQGIIQDQLKRNQTLSEGRFAVDAEDRAYEVAARSASADSTQVRGFGDDSVFGKRTSELLSAEKRLNLSQVGSQNLDRFLTLGANLAFDQPIKFNPILDQPLQFQPMQFQPDRARTAQDVRGMPTVSPSQLVVAEQGMLTPLTTLAPGQGMGLEIGQNQFQATGDFSASLESFYRDTFNAQQEASAMNQDKATQLAAEQFEQGNQEGQTAANLGAGGQLLGGFASLVSSFLSKGTGSGAVGALSKTGAGAAAATAGGAVIEAVGGGSMGAGVGASTGVGAGVGGTGMVGGGVGASYAVGATDAGIMTVGGSPVISSGIAEGGGAVYTTAAGEVVPASALAPSTSFAPAALQTLGVAAGAYTGYLQTQGFANLAQGKPVSLAQHAAMFFVTGGLENVIDPIKDIFGSGKSEDQQRRDGLRTLGQDFNVIDQDYNMELADGSKFDVGIDGDHKWQNYGTNVDGGTERNTFDVDWSDPRAGETVGLLNPLAFMLYGQNSGKFMGHMWNAVTSNNRSLSETKDNIRHQADQAGIDLETGRTILRQYKDKGDLNESDYLAFLNGWNDLMLTEGVRNEITI